MKIKKLYKCTYTKKHFSWWRIIWDDNSEESYWHLKDMPANVQSQVFPILERYLKLQKEQVSQ